MSYGDEPSHGGYQGRGGYSGGNSYGGGRGGGGGGYGGGGGGGWQKKQWGGGGGGGSYGGGGGGGWKSGGGGGYQKGGGYGGNYKYGGGQYGGSGGGGSGADHYGSNKFEGRYGPEECGGSEHYGQAYDNDNQQKSYGGGGDARQKFTPGAIFDLSDVKKIEVKEFGGKIYIDFREYYQRQDGGFGPSKKGCSFGVEVWEKFLGTIEEINQAIARTEKKQGRVWVPPAIANKQAGMKRVQAGLPDQPKKDDDQQQSAMIQKGPRKPKIMGQPKPEPPQLNPVQQFMSAMVNGDSNQYQQQQQQQPPQGQPQQARQYSSIPGQGLKGGKIVDPTGQVNAMPVAPHLMPKHDTLYDNPNQQRTPPPNQQNNQSAPPSEPLQNGGKRGYAETQNAPSGDQLQQQQQQFDQHQDKQQYQPPQNEQQQPTNSSYFQPQSSSNRDSADKTLPKIKKPQPTCEESTCEATLNGSAQESSVSENQN